MSTSEKRQTQGYEMDRTYIACGQNFFFLMYFTERCCCCSSTLTIRMRWTNDKEPFCPLLFAGSTSAALPLLMVRVLHRHTLPRSCFSILFPVHLTGVRKISSPPFSDKPLRVTDALWGVCLCQDLEWNNFFSLAFFSIHLSAARSACVSVGSPLLGPLFFPCCR